MTTFTAGLLRPGDTIGLISPSHVAQREEYARLIAGIEAQGFSVKQGRNLYSSTYGYSATEQERADDLNDMVSDESVKLVLFGGGYGSVELLPLIDYENIRKHPKRFLSYSDGTSILNAIYAKTGLVTYYGQSPGEFAELTDYNREQFFAHMVRGDAARWQHASEWHSLYPGVGRGRLIGGYSWNLALSVGTPYLRLDEGERYVLFLEDHERFTRIAGVSMLLAYFEQSPLMERVTGLLFGSYADTLSQELLARLERFGQKHRIPVAYCDDFGHGANHAILPIGKGAALDTRANTLYFQEEDV